MFTKDLDKLGQIELDEAIKILQAWRAEGLPSDFNLDGVRLAFNSNSGYVMLTNSDYQVAMLSDGKLESWYNCSICGNEGFFEELKKHSKDKECKKEVKDIAKNRKEK